MGLDPEVSDLIKAEIAVGARESARLTGVVDRNLVQGLGVIYGTVTQQAAGVADDAAVMAALRTAIHVPQKPSGES